MEATTATLDEPPTRRVPRRRIGRVLLLVALACLGAGLGYLRAWPPVATVMSASMSPTIETGDVVVMRKLQSAPRVGDIIAVSVPEAARTRYGYPPKVIHRVVRIAPDGEIRTKGDARKAHDPFTVSRSAVQAEVVFTVPAAGRVLAFLGSTLGLIWLAAGALFLIILPLLERQREGAGEAVDGIEEMRSELHSDMEAVLAELVRLQAKVDNDALMRSELEARLAELTGALAALPEAAQTTVLPAQPEPAPDPEPELVSVPEPEPEPEPYGSPIEPWSNVFLPEELEPEPEPEPERYWRVPSARSRISFKW
jgi:signal peptidase I